MKTNIPNLTHDVLTEIDSALAKRSTSNPLQDAPEIPSRIKALPQILRFTGSVVLLLAATVFMLQEWQGMSHETKYYSFLSFTLLLSACGLLCGITMGEAKGARTFLALSAAVIPVHFCQLGGFVYSRFVDAFSLQIPPYAMWVAHTNSSAIFTTTLALIALTPVILLAFNVLARTNAVHLTGLYLITNAFLLVPSRESVTIGAISGSLILLLLWYDAHILKPNTELRTKEGLFVRCMLFFPLLILPIRTVLLYHPTALFFAMLFAALAASLFVIAPHYLNSRSWAARSQRISIFPMILAWFILAQEICFVRGLVDELNFTLVCALPLAATFLIMSFYTYGSRRAYLRAAITTALIASFIQVTIVPDFFTGFLCLVIGIISIIYSYLFEELPFAVLGGAAALLGLIYDVYFAVNLANFSPWLSLAALGTVTILGSSVIERTFPRILGRLQNLKERAVGRDLQTIQQQPS